MIHDLPRLPPARTGDWSPVCRLRLLPCFAQVRRTLACAMRSLSAAGVSEEDRGIVEIVLAEALNNLTEHAFSESDDGEIRLLVELCNTQLRVHLWDNGRPLPNARMPAGTCPSSMGTVADLPEGGFGWHLIRTLTSAQSYRRRNGWNMLRLTIPISSPEPTCGYRRTAPRRGQRS